LAISNRRRPGTSARVLGQLSKRVRVGLVDVGPHRHRDRCPVPRWHEGGIHDQEGAYRVSRTMDSSEPVLPRRLLRPVARRGLPGRPCRGAAAASPDPAVDGPGPDGRDRPLRRRGSPQRGRCWTSPRCTRPEDLVALAPALASSWLASSCRAVDFEAYPILIGRCARGWDGAPHDIHSRPGRPVRPRSALRAQPAQDRAERDPPRQMWA
jgi:hypothetical protein